MSRAGARSWLRGESGILVYKGTGEVLKERTQPRTKAWVQTATAASGVPPFLAFVIIGHYVLIGFPEHVLLALVCLFGIAAAILAHILRRTVVSVGIDGIYVQRLWGAAYVRFSSIPTISTTANSLRIELKGAPKFELKTSTHLSPYASADDDLALRALASRAQFELARETTTLDAFALLERIDAADVATWVRRVRELAQSDADARILMEAWRAVLHPGTPSRLRVASAFLIRSWEGEQAGPRLHDVASAIAAPEIASALQTIARSQSDPAAITALASAYGTDP